MSCPDCISGALITGEPTGYIDASGAYHAPAPSTASETQKTRSILLFTDALSLELHNFSRNMTLSRFGLPLNNCKLIADTLAARLACDVWVPDIFAGRPLIPLHLMLPSRSGEKIGFFRWLQFFWAMLFRVGNIFASRPSIADARALKFLDAVQKQKKYTKVGAVGYCFGGAMAVRMGARDVLQSAVVCHPAPFSTEQLKAIKIPTSWVFAEDDIFFKPAKRLEAEAVFAARKDTPSFIDYECRDYKGTTHGFASRPDLQYPEIKAAFENALDQIVGWFEKTIPVQ